jgi:hypothetical protein
MAELADRLEVSLNFDPSLTPRDDGDLSPLAYAPSRAGVERLFRLVAARGKLPSVRREEGGLNCGLGRIEIDPEGNVFPFSGGVTSATCGTAPADALALSRAGSCRGGTANDRSWKQAAPSRPSVLPRAHAGAVGRRGHSRRGTGWWRTSPTRSIDRGSTGPDRPWCSPSPGSCSRSSRRLLHRAERRSSMSLDRRRRARRGSDAFDAPSRLPMAGQRAARSEPQTPAAITWAHDRVRINIAIRGRDRRVRRRARLYRTTEHAFPSRSRCAPPWRRGCPSRAASLHAAGLVIDGGAVVFFGDSGAGRPPWPAFRRSGVVGRAGRGGARGAPPFATGFWGTLGRGNAPAGLSYWSGSRRPVPAGAAVRRMPCAS